MNSVFLSLNRTATALFLSATVLGGCKFEAGTSSGGPNATGTNAVEETVLEAPTTEEQIAEEQAPELSTAESIDQFVNGLDVLKTQEAMTEEGHPSRPVEDGPYQCVMTNIKETRQYDEIVAFAANSESMWPGALLRGNSVNTGTFVPIALDRADVSISVSLENLEGDKSGIIENPSLSSYRDTLGELLNAGMDGSTRAQIFSKIEQVHSEQQLSLALGASASWSSIGASANISSSFDFANTSTKSRFLVKYTQAYYTVDVDRFQKPSAAFKGSVTLDDIQEKMGSDNPPVYVSSVTYGRLVVFAFESEHSAQELSAALDFTYHGGAEVSANMAAQYKSVLEQSKITAHIVGGSAGDAAQAIDSFEGIKEFIQSGGNYSNDSPGAPIAYKLAYLKDNAPARFSLTEDYERRECERFSQIVRVTVKKIKASSSYDVKHRLKFYGKMSVSASTQGVEGESKALLDLSANAAIELEKGRDYPEQGFVSEVPVDVEIAPKSGNSIVITANMRERLNLQIDPMFKLEPTAISFDYGWRREIVLRLRCRRGEVEVTIELEPV